MDQEKETGQEKQEGEEMSAPGYTLNHIKKAWIAYTTKKVMIVLKAGKWHTQKPGTSLDGALEAKMLTYDRFMSFPTFLEKSYE